MDHPRSVVYRGILFVGPRKSGKDTAAKFLSEITQASYGGATSDPIARYIARTDDRTLDEVYLSKDAERDRWRDIGDKMRYHDPAYLVKECLNRGEIVTGVRTVEEMEVLLDELLVTHVVWVSRDVPPDRTLEFDLGKLERMILESRKSPQLHVVFNKGEIEHFLLRSMSLVDEIPSLQTPHFYEVRDQQTTYLLDRLRDKGVFKG